MKSRIFGWVIYMAFFYLLLFPFDFNQKKQWSLAIMISFFAALINSIREELKEKK
jgi:hypothetical protein